MAEADDLKAELAKLEAEYRMLISMDKGYKTSLNGTFGSLGSPYKFIYAPELLIAVTLTGQLALLMLIEQASKVGIKTVSANTDGVVFSVPRELFGGIEASRPGPSVLADVVTGWERMTGFDLEGTEYAALYNQSVNSYIAIKADGGHKRKGPLANPWSSDQNDADPRAALMKNPQCTIVSDAVLAMIKHGTPLMETIRGCTDIRQFVTVIKVTAGATWRGRYLGKTIRYYYSTDGDEIIEAKANKTGTFKKVPKTDGAAECMTLPDELSADIDYDRYAADAEDLLREIGYRGQRAFAVDKRVRLTKANKLDFLLYWMTAP